jgi:hypothetical protein
MSRSLPPERGAEPGYIMCPDLVLVVLTSLSSTLRKPPLMANEVTLSRQLTLDVNVFRFFHRILVFINVSGDENAEK